MRRRDSMKKFITSRKSKLTLPKNKARDRDSYCRYIEKSQIRLITVQVDYQ